MTAMTYPEDVSWWHITMTYGLQWHMQWHMEICHHICHQNTFGPVRFSHVSSWYVIKYMSFHVSLQPICHRDMSLSNKRHMSSVHVSKRHRMCHCYMSSWPVIRICHSDHDLCHLYVIATCHRDMSSGYVMAVTVNVIDMSLWYVIGIRHQDMS